MPAHPWQRCKEGVRLTVRLTPKSSRDDLEGIERRADGSVVLKARVRAVPSAGKANAALVQLLAHRLDMPSGRLRVISGTSGRTKLIEIAGDSRHIADACARLFLGVDPGWNIS
jgi:uncharacterized protein